jgi:hypothetical protein
MYKRISNVDKIKKGDYLIIKTNEPVVGFIERFGYGLSSEDVEPEDYVARVQQIIDSNNFLVYIASVGYRCIVSSSEVVGFASEEQLTDEDKKEEKSLFSFLDDPQFVYTNDEEVPGNSIAEKCDYLAKKAMAALFPDSKIVRSYFNESDYIKADLLARVDTFIKEELFDDKNFFESLKKKRDYFEDMLQHLRFKEYYTVTIGVQDEDDENITNFLMIAIDTVFEQVVITTDIDERTKFFYSLGPDYDSVYRFYSDFIKEATTQETVINIDI